MHIAAMRGFVKIIEDLDTRGANVDIKALVSLLDRYTKNCHLYTEQ
jgi:hypothetical protein